MNRFPAVRLRRLRRHAGLRAALDAPLPAANRYLWPVFVTAGGKPRSIAALAGQKRWPVSAVVDAVGPVADQGVLGVLVFGVHDGGKDGLGTPAWDESGPVAASLRALRSAFPDLLLVSDCCLCGSTTHGHCGPLDAGGEVDNDAALAGLAKAAVMQAEAGADLVAPSAMMDGQVQAIRTALDAAGCVGTGILSYSTKFASAFYGPFREAAASAPQQGDRRGYQGSPRNLRLALRESDLDVGEGADLLMVKPGLHYLDVISRLRARSDLPIAAYHVSGEYGMLMAAAERGWGDLRAMARETMAAFDRAGTDIIITYLADRWRELLGD